METVGTRHKTIIRTRLEKWDPERLQNAAKVVARLMEQPGWLELQELNAQVRAYHERMLVEGATLEQADYARMMGLFQGLDFIADAGKVLVEKAADVDEKARAAAESAAERAA